MGMQHFEEAVKLLERHGEKADFVGARDADLVSTAERALGAELPPTYRRFLLKYGAGNAGSFEVYGVIDADFASSSIPDGIWYTLDERRQGNIPHHMVVIGETGDGGLYCLDLKVRTASGESPVVIYEPGRGLDQKVERVAEDFGQFFMEGIAEAVSG